MKKLCAIYMIFIAGSLFSQNIRGVYFRSEFSNSSVYTVSLTLFENLSTVSRPSLKTILLGAMPPYLILPIATTATLNNVQLATYTKSVTLNCNCATHYADSFWVNGIKNFTVPDKSKVRVFGSLGPPPPAGDTEPEVTNFPLSPSNYTIVGNQVTFNPYCQDIDGDSLSYELKPMLDASDYYIPSGAAVDPVTGLFSFSKDSTDQGLYAFQIDIYEWKGPTGSKQKVGLSQLEFVMTTNLSLGINDSPGQSMSFNLYPNPVGEVLNFDSELLNKGKKVKLEICNSLGEILIRKNDFDLSEGIDVGSLKQGIYIVRLNNHTNTFSKKFVKVGN